MIFNTYVGLDITCSEIRLLAVRRNKVRKWGSVPVPNGLIKDGVILDPRSLGVIIDGLFKSLKVPRTRVICDVTGLPFLYRTITMPGKELNVPAEAIERAARKEMSLVGEDIHLFWQATGTQPDSGDTNYFVLGVPKVSFEPLAETLKASRIKPYVVGIKPLALARAASLDNACVASLENNYFDIVLVVNGQARVIHSVSPVVRPDDQPGIINEFVDAFNKAVRSFNRDFPQDPFPAETPILLSGAFSSNPELPGLIQEATGHPTSILEPVMALPAEVSAAAYSSAVGLLLKELRPKFNLSQYFDINVNILGTKRKANYTQPLVYAGVAVVVIVLAGLAFQFYMMKSDAAAEVASLKQQATLVTQKLAAAQKTNKEVLALKQTGTDILQKAQTELSSVIQDNQQISARKMDYPSRIVSVNEALPTGADYTKLDINAASLKISGYAPDPLDTVMFANNLEKGSFFPVAQISKIAPLEWPEGVSFEIVIQQPDSK